MSLNNILKKISQPEKTELAKHEVELSLMDDLNNEIKLFENLNNSYNEMIKEFEKFSLMKNKLYVGSTAVKKNYDKQMASINKILAQFEKQSRDLGMNASDNPTYKKGLDVYDKSLTKIISLDNLLRENNIK